MDGDDKKDAAARPGTSNTFNAPHPILTYAQPTLDDARPTTSAGRPKTSRRRPRTVRPDTAISDVGDGNLPQFFSEGDEFDEEEDSDGSEPDDRGVFAFARPQTGAVHPGQAGLNSAPTTGDSRHPQPTTAGTFGFPPRLPDDLAPPGNVDVGGHHPEATYDIRNPPPFSGRHNINNSSFAYSVSSRGVSRPETGTTAQTGTTADTGPRPSTAHRLLNRFRRGPPGTGDSGVSGKTTLTATSAYTGTSGYTTGTTGTGMTSESYDTSDAGSFVTDNTTGSRQPRKMRSRAPLIEDSEAGDIASTASGTKRGASRGSYGMTEMTGDITVPEGKVTWGDGMGNLMGGIKEDSDGVNSIQGVDIDMIEEDSPYPEVRASVSNIDDPEMPVLTFRMWFLGLFFTLVGCGLNTFFRFRAPAPFISPLIVQFIAYPCGKFLAFILPIREWRLPRWLGGGTVSFNPGPFNIKEHALIGIMANAGITPAYGLYAVVSSELYYQRNYGVGFSILLLLATQITGFCFAGICRRFVVWPASMLWPQLLTITTTYNTLHAEDEGFKGGMSRFKFLMICATGAFAYYFLPGFLFAALSYFSWACWIAPRNKVVNQLFGVSSGLGMSMFSFDWTQIAWIGSPLNTPWWAEVNIMIGFLLFYWLIVPILYYTNTWYSAYLPINVPVVADRFGEPFNIFNVMTPDIQLNTTAYAEYSPPFLPISFAMSYLLAFALSTALIVHTALHHGPRIWHAMRRVTFEPDDIHLKLMRRYPEVPDWWFLVLFGAVFTIAVCAIELYHTEWPVWGYVISVILPAIYILPAAFIFAMTNQIVNINLLAELIPGYIFPGQAIPGMLSKTFSVNILYEAMTFVQDQKLGHYMKVPPKAIFWGQLVATTLAAFVQILTKEVIFQVVPDICSAEQKNLLTCPGIKTFFSSSIIWGLIGPARLFSPGRTYYPQVYAAIAGAIAPIPLWFWVRRRPRSVFRNLNLAVVLNGPTGMPPLNGINFSSFFVVGFIFQFWIRRRHFAWWSKYTYILSAALDIGTALSAVFIFMVLGLPGARVTWWGNTVFQKTLDWVGDGVALLTAPPEGFGPSTWAV